MSYLGAISDPSNVGIAPYKVTGDPVTALIAQLNRFAGKTVSPGASCGQRNYLPNGPLPLATALDAFSAAKANIIMYDRLNCLSDASLIDQKALAKVIGATTNPIPWATANLKDITIQIAQFGDSLGLDPATVGITTVDPSVAPAFPTMTVLLLGGLAVAAFVMMRRKR